MNRNRNRNNRNDQTQQFGGQQGQYGGQDPRYGQQIDPSRLSPFGGVPGYGGQQWDPSLQGRGRSRGRGRGQFQGEQTQEHTQGQFQGVGPRGFVRSDDRLREDVSLVLADHPHIDASNIDVKATGGEVTLTGEVPDLRTKQLIHQAISRVQGVQQMFDNIRIVRQTEDQNQSTLGTTGARTNKEQRPHAS